VHLLHRVSEHTTTVVVVPSAEQRGVRGKRYGIANLRSHAPLSPLAAKAKQIRHRYRDGDKQKQHCCSKEQAEHTYGFPHKRMRIIGGLGHDFDYRSGSGLIRCNFLYYDQAGVRLPLGGLRTRTVS
jgi:hypothetical protein